MRPERRRLRVALTLLAHCSVPLHSHLLTPSTSLWIHTRPSYVGQPTCQVTRVKRQITWRTRNAPPSSLLKATLRFTHARPLNRREILTPLPPFAPLGLVSLPFVLLGCGAPKLGAGGTGGLCWLGFPPWEGCFPCDTCCAVLLGSGEGERRTFGRPCGAVCPLGRLGCGAIKTGVALPFVG